MAPEPDANGHDEPMPDWQEQLDQQAASSSNVGPSALDVNELPQEVFDAIARFSDPPTVASLRQVSKLVEQACRDRAFSEVRFQSDRQAILANYLDWFLFRVREANNERKLRETKRASHTYIKGAVIELSQPPTQAGLGLNALLFTYADNNPRKGYDAVRTLPASIADVISAMPELLYLKLSVAPTQFTDAQLQDLRMKLHLRDPWESIKELCIDHAAIAGVIFEEMPLNLEGLHLQVVGTNTPFFNSVVQRHDQLKRLAVTLGVEDYVEFQPINPDALRRIASAWPRLDTLILHIANPSDVVARDHNKAEKELGYFIDDLRRLQSLRRLALAYPRCYFDWNFRLIGQRLDEDGYLAEYTRLISKFHGTGLEKLVVFSDFPVYYEGEWERTGSGTKFQVLQKDATDVRRAGWPVSIRKDLVDSKPRDV